MVNAQIMSGAEISDPKEPISKEEQKNLQAIYKEGSSARDIPRINAIFQENLKINEFPRFNKFPKFGKNVNANGERFGVDWRKSFEENVETLKGNKEINEDSELVNKEVLSNLEKSLLT